MDELSYFLSLRDGSNCYFSDAISQTTLSADLPTGHVTCFLSCDLAVIPRNVITTGQIWRQLCGSVHLGLI